MFDDITWLIPFSVIPYPKISPIIFSIGPIAIRWYGLAYVAGILLGWRYMLTVIRRPPAVASSRDIDDLVVWVTIGVILGGRLGYVLFYKPGHYFANPGDIIAIWQGGMSFHGGLIGVITAIALFAWRRGIHPLALGDFFACTVPIGLFFGRIANFINGELFGRPTDAPWAMVFPGGGPAPRHPSQLYEAFLEGAVLFAILYWLAFRTRSLERPGLLTGVFLAGYGIARSVVELFREPDSFMPHFPLGLTMGQLLSIPLALIGLYLILRARPPAGSAR